MTVKFDTDKLLEAYAVYRKITKMDMLLNEHWHSLLKAHLVREPLT